MNNQAVRQRRRAKRRKKRLKTGLIVGIAVVGALAFLGFMVWNAVRPAAGEQVPIMANAGGHVPAGADPGPFNSDPPTSGRHYAQPLDAGFYEEGDPEAQVPYPEGYILHSLEHGYVVFWYDCDELGESSCTDLKTGIRSVMDDFNYEKVIGFPWTLNGAPLVMTSWGQRQRFDMFDEKVAKRFIRANRNRAPEPNAP